MENKTFGQNRMGISHEGSQGHTQRAVMLKKNKSVWTDVSMVFSCLTYHILSARLRKATTNQTGSTGETGSSSNMK
jgi:hypothetical protein